MQNCGSREYQEDYFKNSELPDGSKLFGVFDGHGGGKAAAFVTDNIATTLSCHPDFLDNLPNALKDSFVALHQRFLADVSDTSGTTALVALIRKSKVYLANLGDCRALIVDKTGKIVVETKDHTPDSEEEAIKKRGGFVSQWQNPHRVDGILAVARALGDRDIAHHLSQEPDIYEHEISDDTHFIILASDGIWNKISAEECARKASISLLSTADSLDAINQKILVELPDSQRGDNKTLMIIKFDTIP